MAAPQISAILSLKDNYTPQIAKARRQTLETRTEILKLSRAYTELRHQLKSTAEISALGNKEDQEKARRRNEEIRAKMQELAKEKKEKQDILKLDTQELKLLESKNQAYKESGSLLGAIGKAAAALGIASVLKNGAVTAVTAAASLESLRQKLETVTKSSERARETMSNAVKLAQNSSFSNEEMVSAASVVETYGLSSQKYMTAIGDMAAITGRDVGDLAKAFGKAVTGNQWDTFYDYGITRDKLSAYAKEKGMGNLFQGSKAKSEEKLAEALMAYMNEMYAGGMAKQAGTLSGLWNTAKGIGTQALAVLAGTSQTGEIQEGTALSVIRDTVQDARAQLEKWTESGEIEEISRQIGSITGSVVGSLTPVGKLLGPAIKLTSTAMEAITPWLNDIANLAEKIDNGITAISAKLEANKTVSAFGEAYDAKAEEQGWLGRWGALIPGVSLFTTIERWVAGIKGAAAQDVPAYASGTSYHPGGVALVGERGAELVHLPRGTQVTSAGDTGSILRGGNTVNVYITGAQRSDSELAEVVAGRILEALGNV